MLSWALTEDNSWFSSTEVNGLALRGLFLDASRLPSVHDSATLVRMKSSRPTYRRERRVLSPEEYKKQRRERRMHRTADLESEVCAWAEQRGCSLRVLNDRHHWLFQRPGFMAEWWPSSARLAVNREYGRYIHAPHWAEVMSVLQQHLAAPRAAQPGLPLMAGQPVAGFSL
jgi:hypothetical protein